MDNDRQYASAMHPNRFTVGGCLLFPFCIGHAILLSKHGSPIAKLWSGNEQDDVQIGLGDIAFAVWICSNRATYSMAKIGSFWSRFAIANLSKRIARDNPSGTIEQFIEYIRLGFSSPRLKIPDKSKRCGAPLMSVLKVFLISKMHRTEDEAINTPVELAFWDQAAYMESEGRVDFWTDRDSELESVAKRLSSDPEEVRRLFGEIGEDLNG